MPPPSLTSLLTSNDTREAGACDRGAHGAAGLCYLGRHSCGECLRPVVYSARIGFTMCIVKPFRSRRSFSSTEGHTALPVEVISGAIPAVMSPPSLVFLLTSDDTREAHSFLEVIRY